MSTHSSPTRFIPLALLLGSALCCIAATPWYGIVAAPSCPSKQQGVCVELVVKTSAAQKAGLQAGDRIVATTKGAPIQNIAAFRHALRAHPTTLPLRYIRGGKPHDVTLVSEPLPSQEALLRRHMMGRALPQGSLWELGPEAKIKTRALQGATGSWILLDFWATWCTPCRAYTPALGALADRHQDTLQVWSISTESVGHLRQSLGQAPTHVRHFHDPEGRVHQRLLVREYPVMIMVDPKGIVRKVFTGDHTPSTLTATIEALLDEPNKTGGGGSQKEPPPPVQKEKGSGALIGP